MKKKKAYKIDKEYFYVEDYIYEEGQELEDNIITTEIIQGFYKPKWNGTEWVEGATQEYIDSINAPVVQASTEKQTELINNLILDNLNMQTQIDNLITSGLGGN